MVNLKDLCISRGKFVWVVYIDLTCLNFGGNILDCSVKALISALKTVKVPSVEVTVQESEQKSEKEEDDSDKKVEIKVDPESREPLRLGPLPLSCTMAVFDDKILLDPTDEEEDLAEASVTVVLTAENEVCHVLKPGGIGVTPEKLQQCISVAKKQSKVIRKLIDSAAATNVDSK